MITKLDRDPVAESYDNALRWKIASRSDPHVEYVVELDSYRENGESSCDDFNFNHRPILARGHTWETAIASGLRPTRKQVERGVAPEDVLRCFHVLEASRRFARQCIRAISYAEKNHAGRPLR